MYCKNCGTKLNDDALFCPYCATRVAVVADPLGPTSHDDGNHEDINVNLRGYLVRGVVGVAAIILAGVIITFLTRLVSTIENVIKLFSGYEGLAAGIGIAAYIACGLLLVCSAVLATLPLARYVIESENMGQIAIDRSTAFSVSLLIICIAVWICKLIFHSPVGGDVSAILYTIFSTYGSTSMSCMVPVIIAIAILYVVRTKLIASSGKSY